MASSAPVGDHHTQRRARIYVSPASPPMRWSRLELEGDSSTTVRRRRAPTVVKQRTATRVLGILLQVLWEAQLEPWACHGCRRLSGGSLTSGQHCIGEGPSRCCARVWLPCRFVSVAGWLGAGVPNSMGSYTQGGRFVSGLALAPRPVNRTAACQRGVHRWHAFPGVSVGQGRGPCHPGVSGQRAASSRGAFGCRLVRGARSGAAWCAVLSPSPPGARAEGRAIQGCLRAPPGARCSVRPLLEG